MSGSPLGRLARRIRERGLRATLRKAVDDKLFRRSTSVIVEYRPEWGTVGNNNDIPQWLSFVIARTVPDIPPLCAWMAHRRVDFENMLICAKIGIFALRDGEAVGCVWVSLTDHHDPESREYYPVPPGEAYHYCWMVDPSVRRTNIGIPLCRHVIRTLGDMGIVRQFGVVDRVNRASYLIQMRFGYRECGVKVMHYYILGTRWTRMGRYDGTLGTIAPGKARRDRMARSA